MRVLRGDEAALDADAAIAVRLDPVSPLVAYFVAVAYSTARRLDRALEFADRSLDVDANFVLGHFYRGALLSWQFNRHEEAVTAADRAVALSDGQSNFLASSGAVLARAGRRAEAESILSDLIDRARSSYLDPAALCVLLPRGWIPRP